MLWYVNVHDVQNMSEVTPIVIDCFPSRETTLIRKYFNLSLKIRGHVIIRLLIYNEKYILLLVAAKDLIFQEI